MDLTESSRSVERLQIRKLVSHPGAKSYEWDLVLAGANKSGTAEV
ncbi:hypothetical protein NE619_07530 [Anaerovorax odorimutans]|uniref:Uncharacterized protein n=1 Tax=Anaerovorax odorimutans TaxID=109327 RepID=A0ABT1RN10_9FIRM|nr:hypothetical protein [Anaerovorax odorimutans]